MTSQNTASVDIRLVGYQVRDADGRVLGEIEGVRPNGVRVHKIPGHPGHAGYLPAAAFARVDHATNMVLLSLGFRLSKSWTHRRRPTKRRTAGTRAPSGGRTCSGTTDSSNRKAARASRSCTPISAELPGSLGGCPRRDHARSAHRGGAPPLRWSATRANRRWPNTGIPRTCVRRCGRSCGAENRSPVPMV